MDEPTARLAPHERERLFDIMRRLAASGVGIIYISHFLEEVEQTADRITMLRDGNVVASYDAGERTIDELTRLHLFRRKGRILLQRSRLGGEPRKASPGPSIRRRATSATSRRTVAPPGSPATYCSPMACVSRLTDDP